MKARQLLLGVMVFAVGAIAARAQSAPVLGNIEAPHPALQGSVKIAGAQWGAGAVAYGPVGTPLVLTGSNFGAGGTVQFVSYKNGAMDMNATSPNATVTLWTSTMLVLAVPSGATSGLVKVTTAGMTSNGLPFLVTPGAYSASCPAAPAVTQLQIATSGLHDGSVGQAYSATLAADGGTKNANGQYTWSIASGTLPSGLSLNGSTGIISGTPTTATGPVDVTVQVSDSSIPSQRDQAVMSLNILPAAIATYTPITVYDFCVPGPWNASPNPSCGASPGGYDNVGNLKSYSDTAYASNGATVVDSVMGKWNFHYDTLNRLATATSAWPDPSQQPYSNVCWQYDGFGNRLGQEMSSAAFASGGGPAACVAQSSASLATDLTSYQAGNNRIATTNARGVSVAPIYDASGDITYDGANQYLYDAEGRICAVASAPLSGMTTMTGYLYDADGTRVAKGTITSMSCDPTANGFTVTENYVLGLGGEQLTQLDGNNNWQRTNVYAAGRLLATYDMASNPAYVDGGGLPALAPALHFHLEDPLGTRRMQLSGELSSLGQPETDIQSLPYGDQLDSYPDQYASPTADDASPLHFTGKERDTESGLDYFGARYFASSMGRFMSPDYSPVDDGPPDAIPFGSVSSPQSLNGYSYVGNNPLGGTDPDGHDCVVQSRIDDSHESVSVSSGTCAGVSVGSGQSATYVAGTVDTSSIKSDGSGGITFGYTPYSGGGGVADLKGAPAFDNPGIDGPANAAVFGRIGNEGMSGIGVFAAGSVAVAGCIAGCPAAATATLAAIRGIAAVAPLALPAGAKVAQMIARAGPEFRSNPAALLEHAKELIGEAEAAGTFVETNYGTVYRVGQTYLVVKDAVLTSFVPNAEAGRGIVTSYIAHGGK